MDEEFIPDFCDTFLLHQFLKKEGFTKMLEDAFGDKTNMFFNLTCYKL